MPPPTEILAQPPANEADICAGEARLRAILDAMPDCVKIFDEQAQLIYINPYGLALHQVPDLDTINNSGFAFVPPEYLAQAAAVHQRVIAGETVVWSYEIVGLEGGRRHVEAHAVPFRMPGGALVQLSVSRDVSERKATEDALRRSGERLRLIQDATGLAEFETSASGIRSYSDRFFDQVGLPPRDSVISFAEWLETVHPDDRERLQTQFDRLLREQEWFEIEFRVVRADTGEVRWLSSHCVVERDEDGNPVRCIGAHFDITDRKRAEEALRQNEARLRAILDAMPDCVRIFDENKRLVYINPYGLELLEAPDLETLAGSGHVPVPPEYVAESADVHNRVMAGETVVWSYETVGMRGGRRHVEAHAVPFVLPDGARAHMCISRDITERKRAEDALRLSEQRLRLVQEATGLADFESGTDGIAHVSESMVEQLGLPAGTKTLSFDQLLEYVHPEDHELLRSAIERSLLSRETFQCEFRIVHGITGEVRWIYSRTKVERDENGDAIRSIGAHLDITDRKRAEEALRESEERFRLAAEAAGLGVWDYDSMLDERSWSGRLREMFGFPPNTPASLNLAGQCVSADERADFLRKLDEIRAGNVERFNASFRINRADDGRERWVAFNAWRTHRADTGSQRIIMTVRDVTEEKTAEERIRWSASHDPLTRLANRTLFQQKLDAAIRSARATGKAVGVLLLDLDHFKQINDSLGHDVGDALLKMFADRLRSVIRSQDTVARLGGDEFAIVVPSLHGSDDLLRLSRSIQERMRAPFIHGGRVLDCRVSSGASMFPDHGGTAKEVLKNADLALYAAKGAGRAMVTMYEPTMRQDLQRRVAMIQHARNAIHDDHVIPYYQPKLDLLTGTVNGFEALLRWRMPNGRIGRPAALEAAFEDLEVAAAISDRMIDRAIADMRVWLDRGIAFQHVAVNAAAAEFRRDNFAERVLDRLRRHNIPTRCFQIEVTETVFLGRGAESVHRALALLSSQGVKIALDDFGTGYASLRHLKQFPVDIIKIDQSFVRDMEIDPGDEAIVRAVINLGRSLGISVVAEGIESESQAERLLTLGCDFGQGFLFAKAVPASRVPAIVAHCQANGAARWNGAGKGELRLVASSG